MKELIKKLIHDVAHKNMVNPNTVMIFYEKTTNTIDAFQTDKDHEIITRLEDNVTE